MITLEKARELLAEAVETQGGGFVYNPYGGVVQCLYRPFTRSEAVDGDDPRLKTGCLVGTALELTGEARQRDELNLAASNLPERFPDMLTQEAADYFQAAQEEQDTGATWGAAYQAAEEWLHEELGEEV